MEDECQRAQEDEKLVILAIYEKEAHFEVNAWKIWKPLSVTIHLTPSDSASRSGIPPASIDLNVVCSAKYPKIAPKIFLSNAKGISNELVTVLQRKLSKKCDTLLGNAMILELCADVREYLYENSCSVKGSFHDNMVKNQEQQRNEKQRQRLNSEIRDVEQVAQIVQEREQFYQEGKKDVEEKPKPFLQDAPIRIIAGKTITVKSSNFGKRQRPHGLCHEWIGIYLNEEVLVSEWVFKFPQQKSQRYKEPNFNDFFKKLDEVEALLRQISALTNLDDTVVPYLFCHVDRVSLLPRNLKILVAIGQRIKKSEQSLPSVINTIKHEPTICRRLAGHAVCALRWLHDANIVHGAVSANCFWVSDNSFRISDAGTMASLISLAAIFQKCVAGEVTSSSADEKRSLKKDLFALGTMIDGIRLSQASSNSSVRRDEDLSSFIKACQSAKSVEDLLNMPYLNIDLAASGSASSRFGHWQSRDNSRLQRDFFLMKLLGSGGFGEVLLGRHKVDDNNYAIKRIPLFAKTDKLNKRITREAKLFSKLNHPNVVRYYSAWIESVDAAPAGADLLKKASPKVKKDESTKDGSLLATKLRNMSMNGGQFAGGDTSEWASSYRENGTHVSEDSSSVGEYGRVETVFDRGDDDYEICFVGSGQEFSQETEEEELSKSTAAPKTETDATPLTVATSAESTAPTRILYIQMEFCGRGTLRQLIDDRMLETNTKMAWRIFREILSGLSYIHKQNMIHRDIKPMNILLDEEDHVKIGDFGLATRDLFRKMDAGNPPLEINSKSSGQTRDIGTELYMAPELFDTSGKTPYSFKIDVYSTGIVLFEMFYKPLLVGMERISTLKALKKNISFPEDFAHGNHHNLARKLIHSMLQEKADCRPTVEELLEDDRILEDVDEQMFQNVLQKSLKRNSQAHRSLLDSLFKEEIGPSKNYCFDINLLSPDKFATNRSLHLEEICGHLRRTLLKHCFEPMYCHQLLSSDSVQAVAEPRQKPVFLLDRRGYPVALPLDLRQNFVRYCCRNKVYKKKRYCIDRVFRSTDGIGFEHPTERWECSIDVVGLLKHSTALSAELLNIVTEICSTSLPHANFILKIGHIEIVVAACRHLNLTEDHTKAVLQKLHELSTSHKTFTLAEKTEALSAIGGSKSLLAFLPSEDSFLLLKEACKMLSSSKDETVSGLTNKALREIGAVANALEALEISSGRIKVKFDASLVYRPATFHDGLLFMIGSETSSKNRSNKAIVLGGGRYDSSLVRERHPKDSQPEEPLCLIGCSIALDMLVSLRRFHKDACSPYCSAIICSAYDNLTSEKFILARKLWSKDVSADIVHDTVNINNFVHFCEDTGVAHVLCVLAIDEVVVYNINNRTDHHERGAVQEKTTFDEAVKRCSTEQAVSPVGNMPLSTSRSASSVTPNAKFANCDVKIAIPDIAHNNRRRITNSVRNALPEVVSLFSGKCIIEIVVVELSKDLVKTIAGSVSRNTPIEELNLLFDGLSRQHGKVKEDLEYLFIMLKQLLSPRQESIPIIILLRHHDGFHKVIT